MPSDEWESGIFGPVRTGWRESTLTRAAEIEAMAASMRTDDSPGEATLFQAIDRHIKAAREAAISAPLKPRRWLRHPRAGGALERALSNLDAAETLLLNVATPAYLLGMIPSILNKVQHHLDPTDPRRQYLEQAADRLGVTDPFAGTPHQRLAALGDARHEIIAAMRAAQSAAHREQVQLRNFRNVIAWTTFSMTVVAIGVAIAGFVGHTQIPLCFTPQEGAWAVVVCPTAESDPFPSDRLASVTGAPPAAPADIDVYVERTAKPWDLAIVELMGLVAAAVAAALSIRGIRGSAERHGVLVWLAALKLPTGAVTAFAGLMLMRGQFVPGLSALDNSAQILAWALVFGYAQQLFTHLADRQGQAVLSGMRSTAAVQPPSPAPPSSRRPVETGPAAPAQ
ncbi:hypothetical protein [Paractinoplanes brasiliensis]|uniref:Uncharacterized protein n=1 Tax=Paractinoplanes brasiliensis TaxID=52695 RepID=A0A4R6JA96_9ACTN|nr:hypothetical protein [Actinoplanes brasiliensis]TDO31376.1 hypothetical protein C8E87_6798 [Actinoplanes brasiliensis]GID28291.1 hypothetical protein Abr02nite_32740 [Actinoplanes brasiliensis]